MKHYARRRENTVYNADRAKRRGCLPHAMRARLQQAYVKINVSHPWSRICNDQLIYYSTNHLSLPHSPSHLVPSPPSIEAVLICVCSWLIYSKDWLLVQMDVKLLSFKIKVFDFKLSQISLRGGVMLKEVKDPSAKKKEKKKKREKKEPRLSKIQFSFG